MVLVFSTYILSFPLAIALLLALTLRGFRGGAQTWRDVASRASLALALLSGLVIIGYVMRVAFWGDSTAYLGATMGLPLLLKWARWGFCLAAIGIAPSMTAKGWTRPVSLTSSALFASFWVVAYLTVEAQ
jgi:hypothetical protein